MKKLFKSYKAEFDMACQVMGAMAEEIIRLKNQLECRNNASKIQMSENYMSDDSIKNKAVCCNRRP